MLLRRDTYGGVGSISGAYLPLAGGTMVGNIVMSDNYDIILGSSSVIWGWGSSDSVGGSYPYTIPGWGMCSGSPAMFFVPYCTADARQIAKGVTCTGMGSLEFW
jgi:hypothetical protein